MRTYTTTAPAQHRAAVWPVFAVAVLIAGAYYAGIPLAFAFAGGADPNTALEAIYAVARALFVLGVPAWFLYFPAIWLTAVLAPALGPALWAANALLLLGAVAWLARRQPTARRARLVAGVLAAWLLIAPLLMAIQAWTPIPIDELF